MQQNLIFEDKILSCLLGGASAIDIPQLDLHDLEGAHEFLKSYGYDLSLETERDKAWGVHKRAVGFLKEKILEPNEEIPIVLTDPIKLKDIGYLLIHASAYEPTQIKIWSCALLRVMHVVVHLRNDLFSIFYDEIQRQVLKPIQDCISEDKIMGIVLGAPTGSEKIRLKRFDVKSLKTADSAIIKALAKPSAFALTLFDKLGVRFVTHTLFDCFRVVRFLITHHLVSFPHIMNSQSNNSLYPLDLYFEVMEEIKDKKLDLEMIDKLLIQRLNERGNYDFQKVNVFSDEQYRFLKFINRQLIRVHTQIGERPRELSFFYPYEVQIMDYDTYLTNISGTATHDLYKERQRKSARMRIFGKKDEK